jgi:2-polyprenyl-6-methoxyphenol hydroxylase-like FAD-dependent oxidoreductase
MPNTSRVPSVIVVGAGLGGLALAQGLTATGFPVTVYERDAGPDSRAQGYRISLNEAGTRALSDLLPPDRYAGLSTVDVRGVGPDFTFANARMRPLYRFAGGAGARTVRRAALRRYLADGVPVGWGRTVVGLRDDGDAVEVRFADGGRERADLVVGCDGANSAVRQAMRAAVPDGGPDGVPEVVPAGIVSVGGHVDRSPQWEELLPLNRSGAVQYFGPAGWSLFVSLCEREDRTPTVLWALSRRTPFDGVPSGRAGWLAAATAAMRHRAWHPNLRRLVAETAVEAVVEPLTLTMARIPKRQRTPLWPAGRVTLLGDAAHAMPPQRGLGGNTAFVDARNLVRALGAGQPVPAAVAGYEREMFARGRRAVDESVEAAQMFHFRNPVAVALRAAALRTAAATARLRASTTER